MFASMGIILRIGIKIHATEVISRRHFQDKKKYWQENASCSTVYNLHHIRVNRLVTLILYKHLNGFFYEYHSQEWFFFLQTSRNEWY